jgi:hypothetical protein
MRSDASWTHPQRVQEQARYFGVSGDKVVSEGPESDAIRHPAPQRVPVHVMTRWEQVPERSRFYALILVEHTLGTGSIWPICSCSRALRVWQA